ncbi:MAG: histidine kinase [Chryseolinea sp.]
MILRNSLIDRALDQLSSINILKKQLVENYLYRSKLNLEALQVEGKFTKIYNELTMPEFSPGKQEIADLEDLCELYDFSNIHLFDRKNKQLFSTDHEFYPKGLIYKIDSAVGREPGRIHVVDASIHSSENKTLLFYYVPILSADSLVGTALVQENFRKIQKILLENTGMGNTGESYIVGPDYSLRSTSRFFPDSVPGSIKAETEAVKRLQQGQDGQGIVDDYRGVSVLSAYRSIDSKDLSWAILSEMDEEEAMDPIVQLRNYLGLVTLLIVVVILITTYFLSNAIVKPVLELQNVIVTLSRGLIARKIPASNSSDEIGEMAVAIRQLSDGFERTAAFASEIGNGDFGSSFTMLSEHDSLGQALLNMREQLREFHANQLKSTRARAAALLEGQEAERTRIVKELHDGVGQMLTAIRMQVELIEGDDKRKVEIKNYINETIVEVKRISYNMMPQSILDFGLDAALQGLCESIRKYARLTIDFQYIKEAPDKLEFDVSIALYRIIQEGLNNIVKHASATHVTLHILERIDELYCVLEDDGKGFSQLNGPTASGDGLKNIRERVMFLNGAVEIDSVPNEGTVIEIHIPRNISPSITDLT